MMAKAANYHRLHLTWLMLQSNLCGQFNITKTVLSTEQTRFYYSATSISTLTSELKRRYVLMEQSALQSSH